MKRLTDTQKSIYREIDNILWYDWDPIGVNDTEEARDEYQGYVPQLFSLKIHNSDVQTIANKLYEIETIRMGLLGNKESCRTIAQKILLL